MLNVKYYFVLIIIIIVIVIIIIYAIQLCCYVLCHNIDNIGSLIIIVITLLNVKY